MKSYDKLEKVVVNISNRVLSDYYQLPENFDRVEADIYPSDYGLNLHITFVMKRPFNQTDSDFFNDVFKYGGIKKKIATALGDNFFTAGIQSSNTTDEVYQRNKWWYDEKKQTEL